MTVSNQIRLTYILQGACMVAGALAAGIASIAVTTDRFGLFCVNVAVVIFNMVLIAYQIRIRRTLRGLS